MSRSLRSYMVMFEYDEAPVQTAALPEEALRGAVSMRAVHSFCYGMLCGAGKIKSDTAEFGRGTNFRTRLSYRSKNWRTIPFRSDN